MSVTLGQIAYEAYGQARAWKVFNGSPMPNWNEQHPELKDAWNVAAEAVGAHLIQLLEEQLDANAAAVSEGSEEEVKQEEVP